MVEWINRFLHISYNELLLKSKNKCNSAISNLKISVNLELKMLEKEKLLHGNGITIVGTSGERWS